MRSELSKLITRAKELGIAGEQADDELVFERIRQYLDAHPPRDLPALDRLIDENDKRRALNAQQEAIETLQQALDDLARVHQETKKLFRLNGE